MINFVFILKHEGGTSAIMTAIIVGLGGKASTTNRGNSLKGFVKDKCRLVSIIFCISQGTVYLG